MHPAACGVFSMIVMQKILGDPGSLCLPVTPDSHRRMVDMIPSHHNIDRRMQFNTGNLRAAKLLHIIDIVDMVILDQTKYASHSSYDSGLLAMMNVTSAHNMTSDFLLYPAMILSAADSVTFHLCRALHMFSCKVMIIFRIVIFSKRNTGTLTVADLAVLDDPAL